MNSAELIPDIFQNSRQLYYVLIGMDGYYCAANDYFLERFTTPDTVLVKLHSFESVHPADHTLTAAVVEQCIQQPGRSFPIEVRKPSALGNYIYTKWEFTYIKAVDGVAYIQCIGFDSTENANKTRQLAEANVLIDTKQEMLVQMLSNSVDVFILVDAENTVTYCSANIEQVLGYNEKELLGTNGFALVHPEDLMTAKTVFEAELLNPGKNAAVDIRFKHKNNSWLWAEVKGKNLFSNPHINAMLINLNDISVRKQAEEEVKRNEERYKAFFNNLSLPLFVVSKDHTQILDVNKKAIDCYGYSEAEFKNINIRDLFVHEVTCEQLNDIYQSNKVVEHRTKVGGQILVRISRHEVAFASTNGYLLQVTDVTETYRTQQENELGFEISDTLIQPRALKENLQLALQKLRRFTNWDLCEFWLPSFDGLYLKSEVVDVDESLDKTALEEYFAATKQLVFPAADYFDSDQINTVRSSWIEDITKAKLQFKRLEQMQNCGLRTALMIPVVADNKVVCCLALMSRTPKKYNRHELNLISTMANLFAAEVSKQMNSTMLNNFFLISRDILTIAGLDGRYIRVNPAFIEFSGYTAEEAKSIHPLSYVHDFDKPAVYKKLLELSEGKRVDYFENRIITKHGTTKWIAWTATPLIDEGIIIASHRDITTQKEMLEALAVSNERYEYVKRATNEAIWDFDIKKNVILRSEGFKQLFGYDPNAENTSLDFWESKLHPEDRERTKQQLQSFLSQSVTNQWQCEYRFLKSDDTYAYVSDKGFKIHDGDGLPIRFVGAMQDISEQKLFAEKLRLSNERYKLVANATREAIWDLDFETQDITWSDGYRVLFGHGFEDEEAGNDFWATNIHPDDKANVVESFNKFLTERSTHFWECEYRFRKKDGSFSFVSDKCYLIYNNEGKPIRVVGAMQDITRQKNLEKEIIEKEKSRQNQIAQAVVFAQEKERAEIGKELHDNIGQLLTTTKLYLEMLKNNQENPTALIDRSTNHINSVINEVRSLSRSLVPHSLKDLGLIASISDLVDSFRLLGTLEIEFSVADEIEEIIDNTLQLTIYRIIQEKLNNVVRHAEARNVCIKLSVSDNKVLLYVEDDGKGFDLRTIRKGQGIMNIKSRAELHAGTAEIATNPGQGCKLSVLIPINKN
ncbi:PAS domain S-box-containing protein [Lacibacter cauensis]|uniref:histidine kinase n=1 Tax=Lacibacter cauensis TaxID=510947 RepID=A0A562SQ14_9BACT|nr:PAS domain S-box protein [Lacibacter cauensis]TWI83351.1 PAS domain S-box-containing protein [Lacibacter cauensis]